MIQCNFYFNILNHYLVCVVPSEWSLIAQLKNLLIIKLSLVYNAMEVFYIEWL